MENNRGSIKSFNVTAGLPSIDSYNNLIKSDSFSDLEKFSNEFLNINKKFLKEYGLKWVCDPLHQWSRQWEYPFVFSIINKFINDNQNDGVINILDAGSGITFFPYYLVFKFSNVNIDCYDMDESLEPVYKNINENMNSIINFNIMDLNQIATNKKYDLIYCISVLEHINNYELIILELKKILKKEGILIITFDISLDNLSNIKLNDVIEFIKTIDKHFYVYDFVNIINGIESIDINNILTTQYINEIDNSLLPWKEDALTKMVHLITFRKADNVPKLTICCISAKNR